MKMDAVTVRGGYFRLTNSLMRRTALVLFTLLLTVPSLATAGEIVAGRVVGVHDGDTITILTADKEQLKIRLTEIDAPEGHQPFGTAAKKMLSQLIFGKRVTVKTSGKDRYGRTLGRVFADDQDVNLAMVKAGGAWAFRKYLKDPSILAAENEAHAKRAGLWALPDEQRMPPWEWRAQRRHRAQATQ
jgi:endonuclease YncB( thermonuclease family)